MDGTKHTRKQHTPPTTTTHPAPHRRAVGARVQERALFARRRGVELRHRGRAAVGLVDAAHIAGVAGDVQALLRHLLLLLLRLLLRCDVLRPHAAAAGHADAAAALRRYP
jgi:hypothetical protein